MKPMQANLPSPPPPLPPPPPRLDLVYAKTATGRHEVTHRAAGLNARQRAALIMLDGQRDGAALAKLMPADQVAPVLAALIALGLITDGLPAAPVPAPRAQESAALATIKAELIAAAEAYLGMMASEIVVRVRQAPDAVQLLRVLGHWHMAMQDSKHGKETAATLLERSRAALQ